MCLRGAIMILTATALTACSSSEAPKVEPNVAPTNYKSEILDHLRTALEDPTNIHDAFFSEPSLKKYGADMRYVVCLRYNAKSAGGGYTGSKDYAAFFYAGKLTAIIPASRDVCSGVSYQPFPELQRLCKQITCPS